MSLTPPAPSPPTLALGPHTIGVGRPVLIIAEAGVNHDGDEAIAHQLVDAAATAGADAVKFQAFRPADLATDGAPLADYQRAGVRAAGQREMLERLTLEADALARLAAHCARAGITFLASPFDVESAALLVRLGAPALKVGSGELTNIELLGRLAGLGLPLLLSTGMADLREVDQAVAAVRAGGRHGLALLHCVSAYPTPFAQANLRALDSLRAAFPTVPVGYSDHCQGPRASLAAVARDAVMIERHLTLDRRRPGPDHRSSSEPGELAELISAIRALEVALGDGAKRPQPAEANTAAVARRSVVAVRALEAGVRLTREHLAVRRPAGGLEPRDLELAIGARLCRSVRAGEPIGPADLAHPPETHR